MNRSKQVITAIFGVLGVLLIAKSMWGGPALSIQLIAGVLLLVYAGLRWRYKM